MDMHIDPQVVKAERKKRAWSQEHLANATGLGLRTIQRIEASGTASNETVSALAAVLSVSLEQLTISEPVTRQPVPRARSRKRLIGLCTTAVAGLAAVLGFNFALADDIALDVGVSVFEQGQEDASRVATTKAVVEDGDDFDLQIDGIARFVITPTVRDDGFIHFNVAVFEFDGTEYIKTREPRVLTENGREAEIVFGSSSGNVFRVAVTPSEPTPVERR